MTPSPKQTRVLQIIRENGGTATFQDFVADPIINTHYANGGKYISELLTRMVKARMITRLKKGVYAAKTTPKNENPLTLF